MNAHASRESARTEAAPHSPRASFRRPRPHMPPSSSLSSGSRKLLLVLPAAEAARLLLIAS